MPSFKDRLVHSDCIDLMPAFLPEENDQVDPQWIERPFKRIKHR